MINHQCITTTTIPHGIKDGDRFWKMSECYVRGSTIKYMRIPDEVIDMVREETTNKHRGGNTGGRGRGGSGGGGGGYKNKNTRG